MGIRTCCCCHAGKGSSRCSGHQQCCSGTIPEVTKSYHKCYERLVLEQYCSVFDYISSTGSTVFNFTKHRTKWSYTKMLLRPAIYCTFGKGKVSRHDQQCRKGNFLTWLELQIQSWNFTNLVSYIGRHLGLSPEMDTWYIDVYISVYIYCICLGRLMVTWKTNIQLWPPCRKPIHQVGVLKVAFRKPLKVDKILKYHFANGAFVWVSCGFQLWTCFFFGIPNPSTGSEPQHVCFKRSKQHLLDFTTASRSPGTIQKATWSKYLMMMEIVMFHLAFYSHRFFLMHLNCSPYFTRLLVTSTYACQGGNLHLSIQTSIFHVPRWNSRRFVGHVISIRPPWAKQLGKGNQCASLHLQKGRDQWRACLNHFQNMFFVSDYWTQLMGSLWYSLRMG